MAVSGPGLMTLDGKNIDLTRGTLGAVGNETNDLAGSAGSLLGYRQFDLQRLLYCPTVQSSPMLVTTIQFPLRDRRFTSIFQSLVLHQRLRHQHHLPQRLHGLRHH